MQKFIFLVLLSVFFIAACQSEETLSLNDVVTALHNHDVDIKKDKDKYKESVFRTRLHGKKPSTYDLDGKLVSIYVFGSTKSRQKGLEDFEKQTASMDLVSSKTYEFQNVLMFYVHEGPLDTEVLYDEEIQQAITELSARKYR